MAPFLYDFRGRIEIHTDGACLGNGQPNPRAGIGIWFNHGHQWNVAEPTRNRDTNNCAEIEAITEALEIAIRENLRRIHIYTDSKFVLDCLNGWIDNWKRNNWHKSDGFRPRNFEELRELDCVRMRYENGGGRVIFEYEKGHATTGNIEADKLAREGALL